MMHRAISNYKITKRKDGRYYVRLQDRGEITHIYAWTLWVITRKRSQRKVSDQFIGQMLIFTAVLSIKVSLEMR